MPTSMIKLVIATRSDSAMAAMAHRSPTFEERTRTLTNCRQVSLTYLMLWAVSGVANEEELMALVGG